MTGEPEPVCARVLERLRSAGCVPAGARAVFLGGSVARGWDNGTSDIDVYLITETQWASQTAVHVRVDLEPGTIPMELVELSGATVDVEYWTARQFERLLEKVNAVGAGTSRLSALTREELLILERLGTALVCSGGAWVSDAQTQLAATPFRSLNVSHWFDLADDRLEDALGQRDFGDLHSAVLSARLAFGFTVDGLLASHGEVGQNPKWRARRAAAAAPAQLPFQEYWRIETMRDYDDASPERWVDHVARICRRVIADTDAG